jgi:hypothetical protein
MSGDTIDYFFFNNGTPITFILEPWAEEFSIGAGSKLSLKIVYKRLGSFETELTPEFFVVWLWAGCQAQVAVDGVDQTPASLSIWLSCAASASAFGREPVLVVGEKTNVSAKCAKAFG